MSSEDLVYIDQALVVSAFFSGILGGIVGAAAFAVGRAIVARVLRPRKAR